MNIPYIEYLLPDEDSRTKFLSLVKKWKPPQHRYGNYEEQWKMMWCSWAYAMWKMRRAPISLTYLTFPLSMFCIEPNDNNISCTFETQTGNIQVNLSIFVNVDFGLLLYQNGWDNNDPHHQYTFESTVSLQEIVERCHEESSKTLVGETLQLLLCDDLVPLCLTYLKNIF